jgi:hypothetical protein
VNAPDLPPVTVGDGSGSNTSKKRLPGSAAMNPASASMVEGARSAEPGPGAVRAVGPQVVEGEHVGTVIGVAVGDKHPIDIERI